MVQNTQQKNWFLDVLILVAFLFAFYLDLTGLVLHQWLGVLVTLLIIVHLVAHWTWVKNVIHRFFGKTSGRARWYAFMDVALLMGMVMIVETGLVISSWFNLELPNYFAWRDLHVYSSIATLAIAVLKIGFHWKWVVHTTEKVFAVANPQPSPYQPFPRGMKPAPKSATMDRRQFLLTMGVVSAGSLLAVSSVFSKENVSQFALQPVDTPATDLNPQSPTVFQPEIQVTEAQIQLQNTQSAANSAAIPQSTATLTSVEAAPLPSSCVIQCSNQCSFPGRCRRYIDRNTNGKCDLGECL
ncbi:MAG: cytochrome b/b6 domain-containing protein [Chloroflexi bacterium]|nr:cytochrome b/b6 domain-containing protein [Chloroflexota bacterium]